MSYLAACGVAGLLLAIHFLVISLTSGDNTLNPLLAVVFATFWLTAIISLIGWPSFIVLRFLLRLLDRIDLVSFGVAGALNAAIMAVFVFDMDDFERFLKYPPNPILLLIGFAAGMMACLVERYFARRVVKNVSIK